MTAALLLAELRRRGVELILEGPTLRYRAPKGLLTSELLGAIREHKPALLAALTHPKPTPDPALVSRLLGMPLNRFAVEGCLLEVRLPWLPVSLWFVPGEADAKALCREGVSRGRVWTARELLDLLSIRQLTTAQVQTVARAKLEFDGEVVSVRRKAETPS